MRYPEKLLPKLNYKIIDVNALADDYYFIRHTNNQDIWDTLNKLKVDVIFDTKERDIYGLSLNLYGVFEYSDVYLKVINKALGKDWQEGSTPLPVTKEDYLLENDRGAFFLNKKDFHHKQYPCKRSIKNVDTEFQSISSFLHKPIFCNFWHFELHFTDNEGKHINRNKKSAWIKNFAESFLKSVLKRYAKKEVTSFTIIPVTHYSSETLTHEKPS